MANLRVLLDTYREYEDDLLVNHKILEAYDDGITKLVDEYIVKEFKDPKQREELKNRKFLINFIKQITDKLSMAYSKPPVRREKGSEENNDLVNDLVEILDLDSTLAWANIIFNATKSVALIPFYDRLNNKPGVRVIPPDRFIPISTNPDNDMDATGIMISLGKDDDGKLVFEYWERGFKIVFNDAEEILERKVLDIESKPFIYMSKSKAKLFPEADRDLILNNMLVIKQIADLYYASKYQSHTRFFVINGTLPEDIPEGPEAIIPIHPMNPEESVTLEPVQPSVDTEKVLELIRTTLTLFFQERKLRVKDINTLNLERPEAAISRVIEEADASNEVNIQCRKFCKMEENELWPLIKELWVQEWAALLSDTRLFSESFKLRAEFSEYAPVKTEQEVLDLVDHYMKLGLMNKDQALEILRPELTASERKEWLESGKEEAKFNETGSEEIKQAFRSGEREETDGQSN